MLAPVGGSLYKSSAVSQDELILALDEMTTLEEGRDASTAKTDRVHEQLASFAMELKLACDQNVGLEHSNRSSSLNSSDGPLRGRGQPFG